MPSKKVQRAEAIRTCRDGLSRGLSLFAACLAAGVSVAWYRCWAGRFDEAGMDGLDDLPRSGRPSSVALTDDDRKALRRTYLKSNLKEGAGSMTLAARYCAKNGLVSKPAAEAILKPRASKHILPTDVRRACRASTAEVSRYRDPKSGLNDGVYAPGWLRMADDGSRRLFPNERWVGDDASVNVGVVVPWARGGDRCADRFGCRLARFQLLALIDCATDFCVGWNYVMRFNDAYSAEDVVSTVFKVCQKRLGAPSQMVMEGGAWQALRTRDFLSAAQIQLISAKGRPNQKLIEGWFSKLWDVLALTLPPYGQIGRFRGEMKKETDLWMRCRRGSEDPRAHFPTVMDLFQSLDKAIDYLNTDVCESKGYGSWIPCEAYSGGSIYLHDLPQGLARFALPVRERRILRRNGMAFVRAACPFGWAHEYAFHVRDGALLDGAPVWISFDPSNTSAGAVVELADSWRDLRAGRVLDAEARCVSPAPELVRSARGLWNVSVTDNRDQALIAKRDSRALVGSRVRAYDERGKVEIPGQSEEPVVLPDQTAVAASAAARFSGTPYAADCGYDLAQAEQDVAALERAAGIA
jgi:hypothetical protein